MLGSLLTLALATAPEASAAETAERHAERAAALWASDDHEGAERELAAGYALDPIPKYLYGLGRIAKDRGDCAQAIEYFERFLAQLHDTALPDESKRDEIEADATREIEGCGGTPSVEREHGAHAPAPPPPSVLPPADEPRDDVRPWHRDPAGATLLGFGSGAVAAGAALLISAAVTDRRLRQSESVTAFVDARERARALGTAGIVTISVGAALLIGAAIRYAVVARRDGRPARLAFEF